GGEYKLPHSRLWTGSSKQCPLSQGASNGGCRRPSPPPSASHWYALGALSLLPVPRATLDEQTPAAKQAGTLLPFPSSECPFSSPFLNLTALPAFGRHGHPGCRMPSCCISLDRADEDVSAAPPRSSSGLRVALAGGGTGGHIYPAIAIADEIRNADPGACILFLGSGTGMESVAVPSAGYDFVPVPSVRLARPVFLSPANILLPFRLLAAVIASWKKLREFDPQVVVGTGGYVAAPVCLAAVLLPRVRLVIQEQNSFPGIANRVLAPFAEKIFLAFPSSMTHFSTEKCVVSGNPVRLSLRRFVSKAVARSHFFPSASSRTVGSTAQVVLVLGGSSGAHAINITVLNMYSQMLSQHKNRFIIWQTGEDSFNEMECLVKTHRRLLLTPFLHTMDLAYAAADVVVSRAGAMTCTEILTTGKPSILVKSSSFSFAYLFSELDVNNPSACGVNRGRDEREETAVSLLRSRLGGGTPAVLSSSLSYCDWDRGGGGPSPSSLLLLVAAAAAKEKAQRSGGAGQGEQRRRRRRRWPRVLAAAKGKPGWQRRWRGRSPTAVGGGDPPPTWTPFSSSSLLRRPRTGAPLCGGLFSSSSCGQDNSEAEIPSPTVAEDHQTKNANIMADIAGSKVLTEDELDSSTLEAAIDEILGDESLMEEMSEKAMNSAMPNASTDIARSIIVLSESFSDK
ncbi:hypothetical protein Taro_038942, partial [Colocasia esculenta]|nr:hypothetical protein [Colocasia esculenta]